MWHCHESSGRPGGNSGPSDHPRGIAVNSGSIWDDSSLSSLDLSPQRQALSESVSSMRSSGGGMETRPGTSNAEARDVVLTTPRRTNWTQDEEESKGSLFEETEEESSPCIPGGAWNWRWMTLR